MRQMDVTEARRAMTACFRATGLDPDTHRAELRENVHRGLLFRDSKGKAVRFLTEKQVKKILRKAKENG